MSSLLFNTTFRSELAGHDCLGAHCSPSPSGQISGATGRCRGRSAAARAGTGGRSAERQVGAGAGQRRGRSVPGASQQHGGGPGAGQGRSGRPVPGAGARGRSAPRQAGAGGGGGQVSSTAARCRRREASDVPGSDTGRGRVSGLCRHQLSSRRGPEIGQSDPADRRPPRLTCPAGRQIDRRPPDRAGAASFLFERPNRRHLR